MGFITGIRKKELRPELQWTGTNFFLPPSRIDVGSKQFVSIDGEGFASPGGFAINTRIFVYINKTSGQFEFDTVVPSLKDKSNFSLVGAFYSNDLGNFGAIANINGKPETGKIFFIPEITAEAVTPTRGGTVNEEGYWAIDGEFLVFDWTYRHATAGVGGSGGYILRVPQQFTIDTSELVTLSDPLVGIPSRIGSGYVHLSASPINTHVMVRNDSSPRDLLMRVMPGTDAFWGSAVHSFANANLSAAIQARVPIVELTNTPLKDL